eukprot:g3419.t1
MSIATTVALAKFDEKEKRKPRKGRTADGKLVKESMRPQIHKACATGDVVLLRKLLGRGGKTFSPNRVDSQDGSTPVHIAIKHGHIEALKLLMEERVIGADPGDLHFRTNAGNTAIHLAAAHGHKDMLVFLLERYDEKDGASVKVRNKRGNTPLLLAASHNRLDVVEQLVVRMSKEEIDIQNLNGDSAVLAAASRGYVSIVRYLLMEGKAEIDKTNRAGCTALAIAAKKGHLRTVHVLLEFDANPCARNPTSGNEPLHNACWKGHAEVASLVLKKGADIFKRNVKGNTPLHCACFRGHLRLVKLLLATAMSAAAPYLSKKLKVKPSDMRTDGTGCTLRNLQPAQKAVVLQMMDTLNNKGNTPLLAACWKGHREVAQLLLLFTTPDGIERKNNALNTPLHAACFNGCVPLVRLLLRRGAENCLLMKNEKGHSPLQAACIKEHYDLTELLVVAVKEVGALPRLRFPGSDKRSSSSGKSLPPLELTTSNSPSARERRRRLAKAAVIQAEEAERRLKEAEDEVLQLLNAPPEECSVMGDPDNISKRDGISSIRSSATEMLHGRLVLGQSDGAEEPYHETSEEGEDIEEEEVGDEDEDFDDDEYEREEESTRSKTCVLQ